mmetsp:Transcript_3717/g.4877  ORF Transcript_3717/g.4877 Transcript_3717/m.4877 type:complete len:487 (-) Transcript_3717:55-1515(-)
MIKTTTKAQAALGSFLLGSALTSILSYYYFSKVNSKGKQSISNSKNDKKQGKNIIPPEMRAEQLSRNELFFGKEGMKSIKNSSVLIVGLGGVGSHTAHMLARAGVSYLRLIDFDQVTLSSLNRHACAVLEDVGIPKVVCLRNFLKKICGDFCEIDARVQMYTGDISKDGDAMNCPKDGDWDVIIDAIDDVPTKAELLAHCIRNGIRVISCMGAGGKSDMTRLHISDLKAACKDPLATKLRQTLKKLVKNDDTVKDDSYLTDVDKLAIIYSSEKTVCKLADFSEEQKQEGIHKFGAVDNMRIRVLPVLGTMPAIMGQSLASLALCELGDKPFSPVCAERLGRNVRHRLFQRLKTRELRFKESITVTIEQGKDNNEKMNPSNDTDTSHIVNDKWVGPIQIDDDDVEYIISEIWRNRCCVTGDSIGTVLQLSRWDVTKPSNCENIVVLSQKAMKLFDEALANSGDGRNSVPLLERKKIEGRLDTCKSRA